MKKKEKPVEIPKPQEPHEIRPSEVPPQPAVPEFDPDIIPEEDPENEPPYEVPEPGEGP